MLLFSSQKAAFWHLRVLQGLPNYFKGAVCFAQFRAYYPRQDFIYREQHCWKCRLGSTKRLNLKSGKKKQRFLIGQVNVHKNKIRTYRTLVRAQQLLFGSYTPDIFSIIFCFFPTLGFQNFFPKACGSWLYLLAGLQWEKLKLVTTHSTQK